MAGRGVNTCYVVKVVLGAAAALLMLASWLVHPAMTGEAEEAGRLLVALLMIAVVLVAALALLLPPGHSNSESKLGVRPRKYEGLGDRLKEAVARLEASHPAATMLMRRVIDQLSFMGI